MAYFRLSLIVKAYDETQPNKYIRNTISEFYGNNVREELLKYEKENNINLVFHSNKFNNIYTNTYTYNEKLSLHQQGQKELTFSLDKMILDNDTWKENPFASKIRVGSQLLLEDKYNNLMLFSVKNINYTITENNIVYNFSCQDSFSLQLSKQNDGYTIKNDIQSKDFIGALNIDEWAEKIVKECKISYKYLKLQDPLYLCTDGTAINSTIRQDNNKKVLKIIKKSFLKNEDNKDLYETIPFSCSSTTANGALISLGEQIGLVLNTATVLTKPEDLNNIINIDTYFWFELSKKDTVNGLQYSPFRNIKTFSLSQGGDSLLTALNINSRTLSSGEEITALPIVSPFFMNFFNSTYWKKYSVYYTGMYSSILHGSQFSINSYSDWTGTIIVEHEEDTDKVRFKKEIDDATKSLYKIYSMQVYKTLKVRSSFTYKTQDGYIRVADSSNSVFSTYFEDNYIVITIQNDDFINLRRGDPKDYVDSFDINVFFKIDYTDEDETFARIADQLPWLENKLIDYTYFIKAGLLSKLQERDINKRLYNNLRKINSDILLNSSAYYGRIHAQTKYLADMTNNIDAVGAEVSNIESIYKQKGPSNDYNTNNFLQRWSILQSSITGTNSRNNTTNFMDLYETTSDYMRKFLNARQRCLKNLYNFRRYFNTELDEIYKSYTTVSLSIDSEDTQDAENIYTFEPTTEDSYGVLTQSFVEKYPNFFIFENEKVKDYNNISLYRDNDRHTLFDKENLLLTDNNYNNLNIHTYRDNIVKTDKKDHYDKSTQYYRQVFFVRAIDIFKIFTDEAGLPADSYDKITSAQTHINIELQYNGHHYPCSFELYSKDRNYFIGYKLYEDGVDFDVQGFKAVFDMFSFIIVGQNVYSIQHGDAEITSYVISINNIPPIEIGTNFVDTINFTDNKEIFYQKITEEDILKSFLCRMHEDGITLYEKDKYEEIPLTELFNGFTLDNAVLEEKNSFNKLMYDYEDSSQNTKIGWYAYKSTINSVSSSMCFLFSVLNPLLLIPGFILKNYTYTDFLVYGGYSDSPSHITNDSAIFTPYRNVEGRNASAYIRDFPLSTIYYRASYNDRWTPINIVNQTNYQNFYTRIENSNYGKKVFSLASNGTYQSIGGFQIAQDSNCLLQDFISDFPQEFFYANKILTDGDIDNQGDWKKDYNKTAWTFGNLLWLHNNVSGFFNSNNYKYRLDKTYKFLSNFDVDNLNDRQKQATYLIVEQSIGVERNLNQFLDYDIIREGKIVSGNQIEDGNIYVYQIIDGILDTVDSLSSIEYDTICDQYGFNYTLSELYDKEGVVENLYYIEQGVSLSPYALKEQTQYVLKDHLLDNTYEWYNDNNERVYTINQIFGNLLYKQSQTYSIDVFDTSIPYVIRAYRYNNKSITPDVLNIEIVPDELGSTPQSIGGYEDFKVSCIKAIHSISIDDATNGDFWYYCTTNSDVPVPFLEYSAQIESNLQLYWNEAYAGSLLCDIFVPSAWQIMEEKVDNFFNVIIPIHSIGIEIEGSIYWYSRKDDTGDYPYVWYNKRNYKYTNTKNPTTSTVAYSSHTGGTSYVISSVYENENHVSLNSVYIPFINKVEDAQYTIMWNTSLPVLENSQIIRFDYISDAQQDEVRDMLNYARNVNTWDLWFNKISDKISFYTIQSGGMNWESFLNSAIGLQIKDYSGWNGIAINYLTSHFVDAGMSNYELLLEQREELWRDFYEEYPYLFLEGSYSNDSSTTSEELLMMAKYAFEDQKYPEKSYSISLIDLVQDVENLDNDNNGYNPKYYKGPELHIGDSIKISAEDYTKDRDDIYEALSQLLFITDISRDLRNDGDCQLTVNTIKYQDKLIRRLAKMIRNNPLH